MKLSSLFLTILLLFVLRSDAIAKGYPDKIVIKGDNLEHPIEITDRNTLGKFSPWYGQFIDWANGPVVKPHDRPSYEVLFYITVRDRKSSQNQMQSRLIFNFLYSPDPAGGPGLIYLPARKDDKYRVNQAAITRDKDDGKWHQASLAWDEALRPSLPSQRQAVVAQSIVKSSDMPFLPWVLLVLSIASLGVVVFVRKSLKQSPDPARRGVG
jgi:hypothetical protein